MSGARPVVQLFHTCLVNELAPEAGMAVARVLERAGFEVRVPVGQTCCGQPAYNAGFHDEARAVARHTLSVLEAAEGTVVVPSGSCADMLVHQYAVLFHDAPAEAARARALAGRTREFSQLLAACPGALGGALRARVAYHPSCHLQRGLGVREEPERLLGAVAGLEVVPFAGQDECCGFGGLFAAAQPAISGSIMDRKLDAVQQSGAERLVSCDLGCLLHLGGGLHRRGSVLKVEHLAQLLDESLP